jgi:dTDP-4-dehydrorhamnose reductase
MRIFTLGNGFIANHLPYEKITERVQLDWSKTKSLLAHYRPDVLINCLGRTGYPNIDWCEKNKEETAEANVSVPIMLAEICGKLNIHMLHIGSGCIYFGPSRYKGENPGAKDSGWVETDFANPQSYYSKTKYACDLAIGGLPYVGILRIRMPISDRDEPRNLLNKLRGYKQVIDIPNSVTFIHDLKCCVEWAAQQKLNGIYHVVNPQPLTATRIMQEYQKYDPSHQFEIINEYELDQLTVAKRSNCILNTQKLKKAGFEMTNSEEALERCMKGYIENIGKLNVKQEHNN